MPVADRLDLRLAVAEPDGVEEGEQRIEHEQRRALVQRALLVAADDVVGGDLVDAHGGESYRAAVAR